MVAVGGVNHSLRDGRAGSEIATLIGKDVRAVQRALNSLLDKGKVRKQGSGGEPRGLSSDFKAFSVKAIDASKGTFFGKLNHR